MHLDSTVNILHEFIVFRKKSGTPSISDFNYQLNKYTQMTFM